MLTAAGNSPYGIAIISAMISPALLILAAGSLIASALQRMARSVDRARALITIAESEAPSITPDLLGPWLARHNTRTILANRAIELFFGSVFIFVAACLTIAIDREAHYTISWLPVSLVIIGMLMVLAGSVQLVQESRLGGVQIREEIEHAQAILAARARPAT